MRRHYLFLYPLGLVICSLWFVSSPERVEGYYTRGLYVSISQFLRILLGWSSFSIGDLFYMVVIMYTLYRLTRFIRKWTRSAQKMTLIFPFFLKTINIFLWTWLVFNIMWGFNYYRESIGNQFNIKKEKPSKSDLNILAKFLLEETNRFADGRVSSSFSLDSSQLILQQAYDSAAKRYPFLSYKNNSFKPSLFGVLGNYMGYGGYYNPFSGEAQINDRQPIFLLPFTASHELAHQLGYAKESEANFIGYLASLHSGDSSLRYSANLEMFLYTNNALSRQDSLLAKKNSDRLSPIAKHDLKIYRAFLIKYQGPMDEITTAFYTRFLRVNNQPEGMASYSRVVGWLWNYLNSTGQVKKSDSTW